MNWLAWDARTYLAALLGAVAGGLAYGLGLPGHELPWLVGLGAGLLAAAVARDRSGLRGWVLAVVALWVSALAQCVGLPSRAGRSLLAELLAFHESLTAERAALHLLGAWIAGWLGARALRAGARQRLAGS